MWSRSNSIVIAYLAMMSILVGCLVSGYLSPLFESFHSLCPSITIAAGDYQLVVVAIVIVLGLVAHLCGAELTPIMISGSLATFLALTYNQNALIRYTTLSALLFSLGVFGMTASRNAVRVLMSIELMLNAVNINLVAFARYVDPVLAQGQIFAIFVLTVAAAEAAVGLAIVLAIYRNTSTVDMEKFRLLKW